MRRNRTRRPVSATPVAFAGARSKRADASRPFVSKILTAALAGGLFAPCLPATEKKPKPKSATAVKTVMDRQIRNAIDAGEGDLLVRSLRQKVVEQPGNIEARLALG